MRMGFRKTAASVVGAAMLFNTVGISVMEAAAVRAVKMDAMVAGDVRIELYTNSGAPKHRIDVNTFGVNPFASADINDVASGGITARLRESGPLYSSIPEGASTADILLTMRKSIERAGKRSKRGMEGVSMSLAIVDALLGPTEEFSARIAALPVDRSEEFLGADEAGVPVAAVTYSIKGTEKLRVLRALPYEEGALTPLPAEPLEGLEDTGNSNEALATWDFSEATAVLDTMAEIQAALDEGAIVYAAWEYEMEQYGGEMMSDDADWDDWCMYEWEDCYNTVANADAVESSDSDESDVTAGMALQRRCETENENFWLASGGYAIAAGWLIFTVAFPPAGVVAIVAAVSLRVAAVGVTGYLVYDKGEERRNCRWGNNQSYQ